MNILGFYLMPHPPIVVPEVGKGDEQIISNTSAALDEIGREVAEKQPDTIIIITPHGVMFQDAVVLSYSDKISGDLRKFRGGSVSLSLPINKALTEKIYGYANGDGIAAVLGEDALLNQYDCALELDHGALVPLYFVNKNYNSYNLVHITYAPFSDIDLYRYGMIIRKAVEELSEKTVIIASGDLSHRLSNDGPYEFNPDGDKFDSLFLQYLKDGDIDNIFLMDKKMIKNAGECGRRSVMILLGALDNAQFHGDLLSYEGTFGVGYGVMRFIKDSYSDSKWNHILDIRNKAYSVKSQQKDPYVRLARESLTTYLNTGKELNHIPDYVTDEMKKNRNGVFVSLKKFGELRGCIGTIIPVTESTAVEIIRNAIEAGLHDPRFFDVEPDELIDIDFSVDVLTKPETSSREQLDPKIYGVIVSNGRRTGLLLPDLEGVDTIEKQLSIALQKGGIGPDEDYEIQRFQVIRHIEE